MAFKMIGTVVFFRPNTTVSRRVGAHVINTAPTQGDKPPYGAALAKSEPHGAQYGKVSVHQHTCSVAGAVPAKIDVSVIRSALTAISFRSDAHSLFVQLWNSAPRLRSRYRPP